jgi:hypothetical protein
MAVNPTPPPPQAGAIPEPTPEDKLPYNPLDRYLPTGEERYDPLKWMNYFVQCKPERPMTHAEAHAIVSGLPGLMLGYACDRLAAAERDRDAAPGPGPLDREANAKQWDECERGCMMTYGGGYRTEEEREIFRHGMGTVFNMLRAEFEYRRLLATRQKGEGA